MDSAVRKLILLFFVTLSFFAILSSAQSASANHFPPQTTVELAELYAPVLYFHSDEIFRPQPVDAFLEHARLRQDRPFWFDLTLLNNVTQLDLFNYRDPSHFLDIWYGTAGESDFKNYTTHREFYSKNISPFNGGPPISIYARVYKDEINQKTILQYWLFYFYNDWFNKHEGDWELVQIILDEALEPEWVVLSQHHGGTRRAWRNTRIEEGTHPAVYVALGSHANYFWGDEIYPNEVKIGNKQVNILDRTGKSGRIIPKIILLPSESNLSLSHDGLSSLIWLVFNGKWGELAMQNNLGGPFGPTAKGDQWSAPYKWAFEQPMDTHTWYKNRLRILLEDAQILNVSPSIYANLDNEKLEAGTMHFIYHGDPPSDLRIEGNLKSTLDSHITVTWPNRGKETIEQFTFSEFPTNNNAKFTVFVEENGDINFSFNGNLNPPYQQVTKKAVWESPDLIWVAGYLPANQIIRGLMLVLAASIIPTLLYILIIYQFDRYDKEPVNLLLAAFLWGAIPSVILAIFVQLFFNLPTGLFSPKALESIQLGLLSPLFEEALKGAIVIYISRKYHREFNGIIDGIIYGAITGLGFAMTANLIGYTTSFLYRGFDELGILVFTQGFLSGLNHALYTAIFGAGLGYFLASGENKNRMWIPAGAFLGAVFINSLQSLLRSSILNQPILAIIINWAGVSTIIFIMSSALKRQQITIKNFLENELSENKIEILANPRSRKKKLRFYLRTAGRKAKRKLAQQFELLTQLAFAKKKAALQADKNIEIWINSLKREINSLDKDTNFIGYELNTN